MYKMGLQDLFNWRSQATTSADAMTDEEPTAEVDEPPDHRSSYQKQQPNFHKATIQAKASKKESLLTKALKKNPEEEEIVRPQIKVNTDISRRRSMISNASMASTAELTSDGGFTSPARTNTPSPPPPSATYNSFAPYLLGPKSLHSPALNHPNIVNERDITHIADVMTVSPKPVAPVAAPKKRCITFACGAKPPVSKPAQEPAAALAPMPAPEPAKRACRIKFACPGPKPAKPEEKGKVAELPKKSSSRSPSIPRKSSRTGMQSSPRHHRDSISTLRRSSQSPVAVRAKPKYIIPDEKALRSCEATRFHEFASDEPQEDDWIREDKEVTQSKLTINDTLKKENAIRRLGTEVEEEALDEDEEEDDEDGNDGNDSDDEDEDDSAEDDDEDENSSDGEGEEASDGNETDNEAGFADSDEESDVDGDFAFWTPGRHATYKQVVDTVAYRPSANRAASASSIDSVGHLEAAMGSIGDKKSRRRSIKIRPGTPELPDSTDFVCGTLDEDRPMETAYMSCKKARENAKHKQTPQDIDPSFPTSDPENDDDDDDNEDVVNNVNDSDEHVWLHGKFEESDHETTIRRRSSRKSPLASPRRHHSPPPRRLHSPPPPKQRLRSPPPRKLFGHSPKRMRSPPPARGIQSPTASPTAHTAAGAISFMPLASRPGLTHTKSLPRAPGVFGRQYKASRLAAATGNGFNDSDTTDGHVRGAIDIVKGLESKRQRRKEKFMQKHCNRGRKNQPERKPQPGKGAERMRELGLLMAGKTANNPYMMSA